MRPVAISLLVLASLASREAVAQPPTTDPDVVSESGATTVEPITMDVPPGCPGRAVLEEEIATLLGRPFDQIEVPTRSYTALAITRDENGFVLAVRGESGERTLRDPSCAALVRAAALIVALQIDADAATLGAVSTPPAVDTDAIALPPPPTPRLSRRARFILDRAARLRAPWTPFRLPTFAIGVGLGLEAGQVPVVAGGLVLDAVLRIDRLELRARLTYVIEQGRPGAVSVRASAVVGTLLGCARPFDASFALALCGGIEGGGMLARSVGVTNPASSDGGFLSGVAGLWLPVFPVPGVDVSLGLEGWARMVWPTFGVDGLGTLYVPDPYGGRFLLVVHWSP